MEGIAAFQTLGLTAEDCDAVLTTAETQIGALIDALGC
jgi:hypothetical protein